MLDRGKCWLIKFRIRELRLIVHYPSAQVFFLQGDCVSLYLLLYADTCRACKCSVVTVKLLVKCIDVLGVTLLL